MDVVERKVENQVQFWSLLGPSFVLLSIAVLLFKVSIHWYFPVSALIGIPLCVKWKMKGMAAALGCLFLLSSIGYQNLELDDRYWHVGLAVTMAFSFIVLTLSLEEAQGLVSKLQLESQSRLDNFALLDEKWKSAEQDWTAEREKSKIETISLTQEISRIQEDKQTFYKLAQLSKDELVQVKGQHDQLLQDLFYKKQQIAQLHERLEETELTIQGFVNSDAEKQIQSLTDRLNELEEERNLLKTKVNVSQTEGSAWLQEKERLSQELRASQEREKLCLLDQQRFQQEKLEQQQVYQAFQSKCLLLEQERNTFIQAQTGLQKQIEQMRYLEERHRQSTQQFQHKIHDLEVKLASEEQQKNALEQIKNELEAQLVRQEKQIKQQEDQFKTDLQRFENQLDEQKEISKKEIQHLQEKREQEKETSQKVLDQKIHTLHEHHQKIQNDWILAKKELEEKDNALSLVQQRIEKLTEELKQKENVIQNSSQQIQKLKNLKSQLESALHYTQDQLKLTKEKLEAKQQYEEKLPYAPGNTRRIEGMYIQLKEQFQEKCAVLDATRRELFSANEKLLKNQKDYQEEKLFGLSNNEVYLQSSLLELEQQYQQVEQEYQQEIEDLAQLVKHLLEQLSIHQKFI